MFDKSKGENPPYVMGKHQVGPKGAKMWKVSDQGLSSCPKN